MGTLIALTTLAGVLYWVARSQVQVRRHLARYALWHLHDHLVQRVIEGDLPDTEGVSDFIGWMRGAAADAHEFWLSDLLVIYLSRRAGRPTPRAEPFDGTGLTDEQRAHLRGMEWMAATALIDMMCHRSPFGLPIWWYWRRFAARAVPPDRFSSPPMDSGPDPEPVRADVEVPGSVRATGARVASQVPPKRLVPAG